MMGSCLVVDAGNTTLKAALASSGNLGGVSRFGNELGGLDVWLSTLPPLDGIFVASVAPQRLPGLTRLLSRYAGVLHIENQHVGLVNQTLEPQKTGVDRLLNCLAAYNHGVGALVVDVGSAVTWDVVSPEGKFLGGAIAPGPQLQLLSLHQHTEQLPALGLPGVLPEAVLGLDSEQAILSGVLHGLLASLVGVSQAMELSLPFKPVRILTGGYAGLFAPAMAANGFQHDPLLTLRGIYCAGAKLMESRRP
ncbi:type III pantothenate kinase [Myxococcota bacterium]|nr:type III pantothenate kinase [Myxococcota bacterium]